LISVNQMRSIIISFIVFIIVLVTLFLITNNFFISLVIAIFIGFIFFTIFKNSSKNKTKNSIKEEEIIQKEDNVFTLCDDSINSLIDFEEYLALSDIKLEDDLYKEVSNIIENLFEILPIMGKSLDSKSLCYEITSLCNEHFPNRIKAFLVLNESHKLEQKDKLHKDMNNMLNVIIKFKEVLNNQSLNDNEKQSLLLDIKYGVI
jgi:hypothetical protein